MDPGMAKEPSAGEAFELLGDRATWRSWKSSWLAWRTKKAKAVSVPFGNLFDEFLPPKALRNPKYLKEAKRFDTAKWKNDLPCSCSVLSYNYHNFNYSNNLSAELRDPPHHGSVGISEGIPRSSLVDPMRV